MNPMRGCRGRASQHSRIPPRGARELCNSDKARRKRGPVHARCRTHNEKKNGCNLEIKMGGGGGPQTSETDGHGLWDVSWENKRVRYELRCCNDGL